MSSLTPIIRDIVSSIPEIDTVVSSFKKGYIDNAETIDAIVEDYTKYQDVLSLILRNKHFVSRSTAPLWEELCAPEAGCDFSPIEGLLAVIYLVLISKEKYSHEIPVLCADLYMNLLLIPGAYGHGILRCSLFQVTISCILRSINKESTLDNSNAYRVNLKDLLSTLMTVFEVIDDMTIKFVWTELSVLVYECCLNASLQVELQKLFSYTLNLALTTDTEQRMGELLRYLLPVISLYAEGKKMDEKPIKQSQQMILKILLQKKEENNALDNPIYALIQRLMINCPDKVDDRRNTVDCIEQLMKNASKKEKKRLNEWLIMCSRCNAANVRMCTIWVCKGLLTSAYVEEEVESEEEEDTNKMVEEKEDIMIDRNEYTKEMSEVYEEENTIMQKILFINDTPLCSLFFGIILNRCNDAATSIRAEATHCVALLLDYINAAPDSSLRSVFDEGTAKRVLSLITDRIHDSAVNVRKYALTAYAGCVMNGLIRKEMDEESIVSLITELLQDSSVMVKRAALNLYYRLLDSTPSLHPLFFSISLSMFENTTNTDVVIMKNCQQYVFDTIVAWNENHSIEDGWVLLEYLNPAGVSALESIMKLLIEKKSLHLGKLMRSCINAIGWMNEGAMEENDLRLHVPRLEENAWMLLSIIVKTYQKMDVKFVESSCFTLLSICKTSEQMSRDKYMIQTMIDVIPKLPEARVKAFYVELVKVLLKLEMHLDVIHFYLLLYLACLDRIYNNVSSIQKAVNAFVVKNETKVNKVLRHFIFKSGGQIKQENYHDGVATTQNAISSSQPAMSQGYGEEERLSLSQQPVLSQVDAIHEEIVTEEGDLAEFYQSCDYSGEDGDYSWLFPYIFIIGELGLLGIEESEEGRLSKISVRISNKTVSLLQALTTYSLPTIKPQAESIVIPTSVRAHALISFGKLCITSATLAKRHLPMFIRELEVCKNSTIRNNIIIIIGDICTKHTSIVERYIPVIANCIVDKDVIVRIHSVSIISKLLLEDYIKLKPVLLCCLLSALVDEDDSIASFAYHLITKQIYRKFPKIFVAYFVEIMSILNGCLDSSLVKKEFGANVIDIHLDGGEKSAINGRKRIYRVILELMDDESKLQISCKLCQNVLGPLVDNDELDAVSNDPNSPSLNLIKDTFSVLCSRELKVGTRSRNDEEELPAEVLESKKNVLTKLEKRTMLEQVLPLLISLKLRLEKKKSVLLRDLMLYFKVITINFKQEMEVVFNDNPRLMREIEYDLHHYDENGPSAERGSLKPSLTNTLATPVLSHVRTFDSGVATPKLKNDTTERDPSKIVGNEELHLEMTLDKGKDENEKWDIDVKRLSFSSPMKNSNQGKGVQKNLEDSDDDFYNEELEDKEPKKSAKRART